MCESCENHKIPVQFWLTYTDSVMRNLLPSAYRVIWNLTLLTSLGLLAHGCSSPDSATSPEPIAKKAIATTTSEPKATQSPTAMSAQKTVTKKSTETAAAPPSPSASAKPKVSKGAVSCPKATSVAYFETKSLQISICMGQDNKLFYREVAMSGPSAGRNFPNATEQGEGNFVVVYEKATYRVNAKSLKVTQNSSVLSEQPVIYHKIMSTTNTL